MAASPARAAAAAEDARAAAAELAGMTPRGWGRAAQARAVAYAEGAALLALARLDWPDPEDGEQLTPSPGASLLARLTRSVAVVHDLAEAVDECAALARGVAEPEPGAPIGTVGCPCCGARLEIEHGDEPGDLAVVGTASAEDDDRG